MTILLRHGTIHGMILHENQEDKIKQLNDAIGEYDDKANAGTGSGDDPGK